MTQDQGIAIDIYAMMRFMEVEPVEAAEHLIISLRDTVEELGRGFLVANLDPLLLEYCAAHKIEQFCAQLQDAGLKHRLLEEIEQYDPTTSYLLLSWRQASTGQVERVLERVEFEQVLRWAREVQPEVAA